MTIASAGLAYIFLRSIYAAFRPVRSVEGPLTRFPLRWLTWATLGFVAVRLAFPLFDDRLVIDVGLSSVAGAQNILDGEALYGADAYARPDLHPDTYGPVNYLLYLPFAWVGPSPSHAARLATDASDLVTLVGLILLGRRLGGQNGHALGTLLGYAWATSPYAFFASVWAYNDMLVSMALVYMALAWSSPWMRAVILALGAAIKFVPALLAPLVFFARGGSSRTRFASAVTSVVLAVGAFLLFTPEGGVRVLYDRTIGWQLQRESEVSLWAQYEFITSLRPVAIALVASLAIFGAFAAPRMNRLQVLAFAAAVIAAFQLSLAQLLPSYTVWFTPFVLVTIVAPLLRQESSNSVEARR